MEATCNVPNGIGIIKVMGRSYAALGSGDVDVVLVPEVPIVLEGPIGTGIHPFLHQRIQG
jgi:6-phosphofructokinase 1